MVRQLKEAKTYQEQIENLINNHALQISDRTKAEEILSTVNYYRLSAYGIGLMQPADPEKYLPGITLEHIYHLYQFDSGLRNILTPLIEYVEIAFRTRLAYQLAITYGAEGYRDASHFSQKTDRNRNSIYQKTIDQLDKEIEHPDLFFPLIPYIQQVFRRQPVESPRATDAEVEIPFLQQPGDLNPHFVQDFPLFPGRNVLMTGQTAGFAAEINGGME